VESWKRRLFVLEQNKLCYYSHVKHEKDKSAKGEILLSSQCQVGLVDYKSHDKIKNRNCLWLYVPEIPRKFYAFAESYDDIDLWIKAIQNNINVLVMHSAPPVPPQIATSTIAIPSPNSNGNGGNTAMPSSMARTSSQKFFFASPKKENPMKKSQGNMFQGKGLWKINSGINSARAHAALFSYGKNIYLFGGIGAEQSFNDLWSTDAEATKKWQACTQKGDIPTPRSSMASAFYGVNFYVFGGQDQQGRKLDDFYRLDLETMSWTKLEIEGERPRSRSNAKLVAHEGKLYLCGGDSANGTSPFLPCYNDLFEFNIDTNEWRKISINFPDMEGRTGHTLVAYNGSLFFYGGLPFPNVLFQSQTLTSFYAYNIDSNDWKMLPRGPPMFGHSSCISRLKLGGSELNTLTLIVCGVPCAGSDAEGSKLELFAYDFDGRTWYQLPVIDPAPKPLLHHASLLLRDSLFIYGGMDAEDGTFYDLFFEYNLRET